MQQLSRLIIACRAGVQRKHHGFAQCQLQLGLGNRDLDIFFQMPGHNTQDREFVAFSVAADFNEDDVWTIFHSFAFDFSVWEMFGALVFGGRCVVVPRVQHN